jgi:RNA recognition motif-containing protein
MSDAADANRAISSLNGEALNGRSLNVNEARPREGNGGGNRSGGGAGQNNNRPSRDNNRW